MLLFDHGHTVGYVWFAKMTSVYDCKYYFQTMALAEGPVIIYDQVGSRVRPSVCLFKMLKLEKLMILMADDTDGRIL